MCCIVIKDNILQTEVAKKDLGLFFVLKGESAFINFTLEIYCLFALVVDVHLK